MFRFSEGSRYPWPIDFGGFVLKRFKPGMIYEVRCHFKLYSNCAYYIGKEQDNEINTLIGISLGLSGKNTIQLGWRFDMIGGIEISGNLCHNGKQRVPMIITTLPVNKAGFDVRLKYNSRLGTISVALLQGDMIVGADVWQYLYPYEGAVWAHGLGLRFGKTKKTPHVMDIVRSDTRVKFV